MEGRDGLGFSSFYVPRESFDSLIGNISDRTSAYTSLAEKWIGIYLDLRVRRRFDQRNIDELQTANRGLADEIETAGSKINEVTGQIAATNQELASIDGRLAQTMTRLQQQIDESISKRR
ncbi:2-alkenal reductase (plasmid) [Bradyrhizobium diazoefficiens]|uniref:2-alkenal reductase n=1 Tax=Bradyrhizobium diazoefficiens TaxID=1355477 RepID=A0A0E4BXE2_9BRAD|nr:2-alkenal reductase [Bradyrhizobium diazoefficiens]